MKRLLLFSMFLGLAQLSMAVSESLPVIPFAIVQFDDRDGSSFEKAIIIEETSEKAGVPAEYEWLRKHYPGYKKIKQSLRQYQGRYYDILLIKHNGKKKTVYFDIDNFFGRW